MFDEEDLAEIRETREQWETETRDPFLERFGERSDRFATVSNLEVDRLYDPTDVADLDYLDDLGTSWDTRRACTAARRDGRGRPDNRDPRRP